MKKYRKIKYFESVLVFESVLDISINIESANIAVAYQPIIFYDAKFYSRKSKRKAQTNKNSHSQRVHNVFSEL